VDFISRKGIKKLGMILFYIPYCLQFSAAQLAYRVKAGLQSQNILRFVDYKFIFFVK
jgi:hypothetical protein